MYLNAFNATVAHIAFSGYVFIWLLLVGYLGAGATGEEDDLA